MMISRLARTIAALVDPLAAGTRALLLRLVGRFGWKAVLIGAAILVYAAARYRTWIWAGVAVLCAAAWAHAPGPVEELEEEGSEEPEEEGEEPPAATPEEVYQATLEWILQQTGDRQGVHLRDLLTHAQEHGMFDGLDVTDLRTHLEGYGFPVRDRVRVRGLGVTVGIHRDDIKAPSEPSPETEGQDLPNPELHAP